MQSLVLFNQKLKTASFSTANTSTTGSTFTVPTGKRWIINTVWVEFTSSAGVGNRQVEVSVNSASDLFSAVRAGAVQAASLTRYYLFATGVSDLTSFRDTDFLMTPLPAPLEMDPGEILIVKDKGPSGTAIDEGVDDMVIHVRYYEQQDI